MGAATLRWTVSPYLEPKPFLLPRMTTRDISTMMRIPLISILIDRAVIDRECWK
jgi:hypothetical protein